VADAGGALVALYGRAFSSRRAAGCGPGRRMVAATVCRSLGVGAGSNRGRDMGWFRRLPDQATRLEAVHSPGSSSLSVAPGGTGDQQHRVRGPSPPLRRRKGAGQFGLLKKISRSVDIGVNGIPFPDAL